MRAWLTNFDEETSARTSSKMIPGVLEDTVNSLQLTYSQWQLKVTSVSSRVLIVPESTIVHEKQSTKYMGNLTTVKCILGQINTSKSCEKMGGGGLLYWIPQILSVKGAQKRQRN